MLGCLGKIDFCEFEDEVVLDGTGLWSLDIVKGETRRAFGRFRGQRRVWKSSIQGVWNWSLLKVKMRE